MSETYTQKKRRLAKRNKHRDTTCKGCRHDYYNWPKPSNGWDVEVAEDKSCWHIDTIKRGKCQAKS